MLCSFNRITALACVALLMGCSLQQDIDEMKAISKDLQYTANQAIKDARSAEMLSINIEAFNNLLEAKTLEQKILYARVYMRTFEFQAWTGRTYDTPEYLEELQYIALKKFYADLTEVIQYDKEFLEKLPPLEKPVKDNAENLSASAYAIAISLDETSNQIIANRERGLGDQNLLWLIYEGVGVSKSGPQGPTQAGWKRHYEATLIDIHLAEIILQIRYNAKVLKFIKMISPVDLVKAQDDSDERKKLDKMFSKKWAGDFTKLKNKAQAVHALELADYALEVKEVFVNAFSKQPQDVNMTGGKFIKRYLSKLLKNMTPPQSSEKSDLYQEVSQKLSERIQVLNQ